MHYIILFIPCQQPILWKSRLFSTVFHIKNGWLSQKSPAICSFAGAGMNCDAHLAESNYQTRSRERSIIHPVKWSYQRGGWELGNVFREYPKTVMERCWNVSIVRNCLQITAASLWQFLLYFRAFAWSNCSSYFPTIPKKDVHDIDKPSSSARSTPNSTNRASWNS